MNYERKFIKYLKSDEDKFNYEDHIKLVKKGWPDFLIRMRRSIILIEIKGRKDAKSFNVKMFEKNQVEFFQKHPYLAYIAFYGKEKVWRFYMSDGIISEEVAFA